MSADSNLLADVPLFNLLDDQERTELATRVEIVKIPKGECVYKHGDPGDSIYIIREGEVEIYYHNHAGERRTLEFATKGDFFGELSFLDNGSRSASVAVVEDLEALNIDRESLHEFLKRHPEAALDIFTSMGKRFRKLVERMQNASPRNLNVEAEDKRSKIEKAADWIAAFSGSILFLGLHIVWFAVWIVINMNYIPAIPPFDPYPFGLLTMVVSLEAIVLSVFVLLSQNRQVEKDHLRADIEYEVNLRAEIEINHLHTKFDQLSSEILTRLEKMYKQSCKDSQITK
jgi:CRP/FNR family cyclic AMP-dependent transcriptional regulator